MVNCPAEPCEQMCDGQADDDGVQHGDELKGTHEIRPHFSRSVLSGLTPRV